MGVRGWLETLLRGDWLPRASDWEIRHRPGGRAAVRGRVPASKVAAIRDFFERELNPTGAVRVWGSYGPGRRLRVRFAGPLSAGQRQRARNFLIEHLG